MCNSKHVLRDADIYVLMYSGTDEFMHWLGVLSEGKEKRVEPYFCLNMGTGTLDEALAWLSIVMGPEIPIMQTSAERTVMKNLITSNTGLWVMRSGDHGKSSK